MTVYKGIQTFKAVTEMVFAKTLEAYQNLGWEVGKLR